MHVEHIRVEYFLYQNQKKRFTQNPVLMFTKCCQNRTRELAKSANQLTPNNQQTNWSRHIFNLQIWLVKHRHMSTKR